jgi:hypothetical protein
MGNRIKRFFTRCRSKHPMWGSRCVKDRGHKWAHTGVYYERIHAWVSEKDLP